MMVCEEAEQVSGISLQYKTTAVANDCGSKNKATISGTALALSHFGWICPWQSWREHHRSSPEKSSHVTITLQL
jgi:hypothetical protein